MSVLLLGAALLLALALLLLARMTLNRLSEGHRVNECVSARLRDYCSGSPPLPELHGRNLRQARKLVAIAIRGATACERQAARTKLEGLAASFGTTADEVIALLRSDQPERAA